ncbi:hypothetical protein CCP1ISM_460004 [Azospirillaceae bacterium]
MPGQEERIMSIAGEQLKAEGFNSGIAQGRAEGKAEGKAETLLRLLRRRFHALAPDVEVRVQNAGNAQLDEWLDRFVDAKALTDVFTDLAH